MSVADDELAIDLRHVAKVYRGKVNALRGIEMHVRRGEVFGLLGPNGAGKSTLVKILMTVVRPTRVDGSLLGAPVGHKPSLRRVGYLPENHRFPRYLTGRQTLEFFAALSKVDRRTRRRRAQELLHTVGMADWADRRVSVYSKGMMQRIGLAQALVHDPELVFLDEPTDGVDPVGRNEILRVLGNLREQGKTVFVNSHALSELESICNRVAILVQGKVARQGTIDELTIARQRYEIEVAADAASPTAGSLLAALPATFDPAPAAVAVPASGNGAASHSAAPLPAVRRGMLRGGPWIEAEGLVLRVGTTDAKDLQPLIDSLRAAGFVIRRVQPVRPSLNDLFLEAVTDPQTGRMLLPGARPSNPTSVSNGVSP